MMPMPTNEFYRIKQGYTPRLEPREFLDDYFPAGR